MKLYSKLIKKLFAERNHRWAGAEQMEERVLMSIAANAPFAWGTAIEGTQSPMWQVASFTTTEDYPAAGSIVVTVAWGDGSNIDIINQVGTSGNLQLLQVSSKNFIVLAQHTYTSDSYGQPGHVFTGDVGVIDANGGPLNNSVNIYFPATVADAQLTPYNKKINAVEGKAFSGVMGSFSSANLSDTADEFTATIDFGDGSKAGIGKVKAVAATPGKFTVSATHTWKEEGVYTAMIHVENDGGPILGTTTDIKCTVTVANAELTALQVDSLCAVEGLPMPTSLVAAFTDADPRGWKDLDDYTANVDWGDGTPVEHFAPGAITWNAGAGQLELNATHTFAEEGNFVINWTVFDDEDEPIWTKSASGSTNVYVADAPLHASPISSLQKLNTPFTTFVASFTDENPNPDILDFSADIYWGDGTSSLWGSGTVDIVQDGRLFYVEGTHSYCETGDYVLKVIIRDAGGASTSIGGYNALGTAPIIGVSM